MKKILLSLSFISGLVIQAQTLTRNTHAPFAGDSYSTYQCDSTGITTGASGAGVNWTYATLNIHNSLLSNYTAVTSTNANYNPADVMVSASLNNSAYFQSTSSDLKYYGGNVSFAGNSGSLTYASPAVFAVYPMSLNSAVTSVTSGTAMIGVSASFNGTCSVIADATGTLALPGRTFDNIIRVVSSQTLNIASGVAIVTQVNYDYYAVGTSKAPVFSIATSTLVSTFPSPSTQTQSFVTVQKDYLTVGVNENKKDIIELAVFPNPASSVVNFKTTSTESKKVIVYDITGKIVTSEILEDGKAKANISNLNNGIYIYTVLDKNNQTLTTSKFSVSK